MAAATLQRRCRRRTSPRTAASARPRGCARACSSGFAAQSRSPSGAAAVGSSTGANRAPAVLRRAYLQGMSCAPIPSTRPKPRQDRNLHRPKSPRRREIVQGARYVDEPVTMIRKWGSSTDTAWYLQGGNYNVEALTDRTGSVIERYEYTPYGKPTVYTGAGTDGKWFTSDDVSSTVSAKGNNVLFQGRELDAESNLMFYRTRYYQPTLGRFVSRDPIRYQAQDENFYRFESGNPIQFVDPIGLTTSTHSTTLNGDFSNLRGPYDGYFGVTKALATPTFMSPSEIRSSTSEEDDCNCTSKKKYTVCANGVGYYSVVVKVDIWLSSWIPPKSASPAQRSEWNRARAATAIHEQGHADIYNAAAGHHEIPISGACGSACTERAARSAMIKSVGSALQKDFDSMWSDANQKSDQYDADTNHGATQGATLNQGVQ